MLRLASRFEDRVEATVKRAAVATDRTAVLSTPVDTGRARANWIPSLQDPKEELRTPVEAGAPGSGARAAANSPLAEAAARVAAYRLEQGHSIFLTNIVPYIGFLEAGSSAQAPAGMTALAIQAGKAVVEKARPLKGAARGS